MLKFKDFSSEFQRFNCLLINIVQKTGKLGNIFLVLKFQAYTVRESNGVLIIKKKSELLENKLNLLLGDLLAID